MIVHRCLVDFVGTSGEHWHWRSQAMHHSLMLKKTSVLTLCLYPRGAHTRTGTLTKSAFYRLADYRSFVSNCSWLVLVFAAAVPVVAAVKPAATIAVESLIV